MGLAETSENSRKIEYPKTCPSCGSDLKRIGPNLFCTNHKGCFEQIIDRLTHFVSRDAFNIEGFRDKTIKVLFDNFGVSYPYELFNLKPEMLEGLEGFKEKKINNLMDSLEKSKKVDWSNFIFALGIMNVGKKTAFVLSKKFHTLDDIKNATLETLTNIEDIGEIVATSIIEYFEDSDNLNNIEKLFEAGVTINKAESVSENATFTNKTVVLTGSLTNFTRPDLTKLLLSMGANVTSSVSKKTDIVIAGVEAGSKLDKAKELNIRIIEESELMELLK